MSDPPDFEQESWLWVPDAEEISQTEEARLRFPGVRAGAGPTALPLRRRDLAAVRHGAPLEPWHLPRAANPKEFEPSRIDNPEVLRATNPN